MKIYCCGCKVEKEAQFKTGKDMYPHRKDLHALPFWKCPDCECFVGCHHKTKNSRKPLGVMATKEIKFARMKIHEILDPLWKSGEIPRGGLYGWLSERLGYTYHTAEIKDIEEARRIYKAIQAIRNEIIESRYSPTKALRQAVINV